MKRWLLLNIVLLNICLCGQIVAGSSYVVKPTIQDPSMLFNDYTKFLTTLITSDFTVLKGVKTYPDSQLSDDKDGVRNKLLGSYKSDGTFSLTPKVSITTRNNLCNSMKDGLYQIDEVALAESLKSGDLFESFDPSLSGRLLGVRLLVQEYFLGQLLPIVYQFSKGHALKRLDGTTHTNQGKPKKIMKDVVTSLTQALNRTRYMRQSMQLFKHRNVITLGEGDVFTPVDFFAGVIIINNSQDGITVGKKEVVPQGIGFLHIESGKFMNNWTSKMTNTAGMPTRSPLELGDLGASQRANLELTPTADGKSVAIGFFGKTYIGSESTFAKDNLPHKVYFEHGAMTAFFSNLGPWAVIIEIPPSKSPYIKGLARLSTGDFGKYLMVNGEIGLPTTTVAKSIPSTSLTVKSNSPSLHVASNFTLFDLIQAPYECYKKTYISAWKGSGKRKSVTDSDYPYTNFVMQGFFNGYLETSGEYRALADDNNNKMGPPQPVQLTEKREYPGNPQIYGAGSGIDKGVLRALRLTKALMFLDGISANVVNSPSLLRKILKNPTDDIKGKNKKMVYIAGGSLKVNYPYVPVILINEANKTKKLSTKKLSTKKLSTKKLSTKKLSTKKLSTKKLSTKKHAHARSADNASVKAYKEGYEKGFTLGGKKQNLRKHSNISSTNHVSVQAYKEGYKKGFALGGKKQKLRKHSNISSTNHVSVQAYKEGYEKGLAAAKTQRQL